MMPFLPIFALLVAAPAEGPGPGVTVLVPGFEARALPVRLPVPTGLAFAPDGRLFVLGDDGRVFVLTDADGDGVEDLSSPYWDRSPLATPRGLAWRDEGLYVASLGKVSLLRDEDGDGRADREQVVAEGWPKIPNVGNGDAMGLAFDRRGRLYFGLSTLDRANPYLLKDGQARSETQGERGAIVRMSADGRTREVFATGLKSPFGLAFNRRGDLFATDQVGANVLPGANPLDELNHIQEGKHYGFPNRHPEHPPGVIDEPPVVEFGPQHPSPFGLAFNDPGGGQGRFGPEAWEGDAFVCGPSRGKVWRVRLVKTARGYVGGATLFASADVRFVTATISPRGELYLACHLGSAPRLSGPAVEGRIVKVAYADPDAPQPVAAWPAGPIEVRVAFDRPIDPASLDSVTDRPIAFGRHVRAADRLEVHEPLNQEALESRAEDVRGALKIAGARLEDGGRTLVLATDPHPMEATYALTLPGIKAVGASGPGATVDLAYDLSGVEVSRSDADEEELAATWWPHPDPDVARAFLAGAVEQERFLKQLSGPGRLMVRTLVGLPEGKATLSLTASGPIEAAAGAEQAASEPFEGGLHRAVLEVETAGEPIDLEATVSTGGSDRPPTLHLSYHTSADPTERPVPPARLAVPWAPAPPPPTASAGPPPELAGGDPERGEAVFFGDRAKCSSCHAIGGKGGTIGPDLTEIHRRDAATVYRDIAEPSATIHPDYVPFTVALTDGRVLVGVVRAEGPDALRVSDTSAQQTLVRRAEVEELRPSGTSIMPVGLAGALGEADMRDLVAFLMKAREP